MDDFDLIFYSVLLILFILFAILIVEIPYKIARNRQLDSRDQSIIRVLCWVGLFIGITWIIALIWSIFGSRSVGIVEAEAQNRSLDALVKLHQLRKEGAISDQEFEKQKKLMK